MFKRVLSLFIALSALFTLSACGNQPKNTLTYELALLTDSTGLSEPGSANNEVWNGLVRAAADNKKSYKQYTAERDTNKYYRRIADEAVKNNAKLILLVGESYGDVLSELSKKYPNEYFLWIDGHKTNETYNNVCAVTYKEEQLGFIAGYAAVKDGYKKLGYSGNAEYGCGFLLGADYAAKELKLQKSEVSVNCKQETKTIAIPEVQEKYTEWYKGETEVIFTGGGNLYESAVKAAEAFENKFVITEGTDKTHTSSRIISTAVKKYDKTVYTFVNNYCKNEFAGGQLIVRDISTEEIGISESFTKWKTFNAANYKASEQYLKATHLTVTADFSAFPLSLIKVTE